jgi:DNA-binding XRE family transcriptional regulator
MSLSPFVWGFYVVYKQCKTSVFCCQEKNNLTGREKYITLNLLYKSNKGETDMISKIDELIITEVKKGISGADELRAWREKKGMSVDTMALDLGVTRQTVYNLEKGIPCSAQLGVRVEIYTGGDVHAVDLMVPEYEALRLVEYDRLVKIQSLNEELKSVKGASGS